MKKSIKLLSLIMAIVLMAGIMASCGKESDEGENATVDGAATAENPWKCGASDEDSVTAYIDGTTLWISGEGKMADYANPEDRPWDEFTADIDNIYLDSEVTAIGSNAFRNIGVNTDGADIFIGEELESIGESAFEAMKFADFSMPTLPESLVEIGSRAFADSTLVEMHLDGKPEKIGDDAFASDELILHVRKNQGWTDADMKDFGGKITYKILCALEYESVYDDGTEGNGVEYHDADEEFEFDGTSTEDEYVFDHFEAVSDNITVSDAKNPVLKTKLNDDAKIKVYYKKK